MAVSRLLLATVILQSIVFATQACSYGQPQWTGEWFWNQRYSMGYDESRRFYGFWSYNCNLRGTHLVVQTGYGRHYNDYLDDACIGCLCRDNDQTMNCSLSTLTSGTVFIKRKSYMPDTIGAGYFHENVTHITLLGVPLQICEEETFWDNPLLEELTIHNTDLQTFPDLQNNTLLKWLDLSRNRIFFEYDGYTERNHLPRSLTHVNLVENEISWIPKNLFAGTNIQFLALSANNIGPVVPADSFINMPQLRYISFDANELTQVSKTEMNKLSASPLQHLNLSNNQIECVQAHSFDGMLDLQILELHHNKIPDFSICLFHNLQEILHIDLSHNLMKEIKRRNFNNLPNLKRLRLHNQQIWRVDTHAFYDVPALGEIMLGRNLLPTFPHATFEWRDWPALHSLHLDYNLIESAEEYPEVSFKGRDWERYVPGLRKFLPFRSLTSLNHLKLNGNRITAIKADTFCPMPKLHSLNIADNELTSESLHKDIFLCTQQIYHLNLAGNKFEYVPPAVIGKERMPVIHELNLNRNKIAFVESGDFAESTDLAELWLSHNSILTIEDGAFPDSLVELTLRNNKFFTFKHANPFTNLTKLRELYLSRNAIEYIPRTAFDNLKSLVILSLDSNKIGMIPYEAFQDSPKIRELFLHENEISYIEDGALDHLISDFRYYRLDNNLISHLPDPSYGDFADVKTESFRLNNNRIERVRSLQFRNISTTDHITMNANRITTVESQGFTLLRANDDINFNDNKMKYLHQYAFDDIKADEMLMTGVLAKTVGPCTFRDIDLRHWQMQDGSVEVIEAGAFCSIVVRDTMRLDNNNIKSIEGQIFANSSYVRSLRMNKNCLQTLPDNAFDDVTIYYIDLSENKLNVYPMALQTMDLRTINLNYNEIRAIPSNAFTGQSNLQTLLLRSNWLSELPNELFSELTNLRHLDLQDNAIEIIEPRAFSNLGKVEHIDLRKNLIQHLPAFKNLPKLSTLYLNENTALRTMDSDAFDAAANILTNLQFDSTVQLSCNCDVIKALFEVRAVVSDGKCLEPASVAGALLDSSTSLSQDYFVNKVNATPDVFWCSVAGINGYTTIDLDINVEWQRPTYLYYAINETTNELNGVQLEEAVGCLCVEKNVSSGAANSSSNNTTEIRQCGPNNRNNSEDCITDVVTYEVVCSSSTAPTLSAITAATSWRFHPVEFGTLYSCSVKLLFNGTESTFSPTTRIQVQDGIDNPATTTFSLSYWELEITHYDFSIAHQDFGGSPTRVNPTQPTYVESPFGGWLTLLDPTSSSFDQWFREISGVNEVFPSKIYLMLNTSLGQNVHKFYDDTFYPLDGLGYRSESQRDCNAVLHNFGFTSTIQTGFLYRGSESFTIGGGDCMWLYVNKRLVAEYNNYANPTKTHCVRVKMDQPLLGYVNVTTSSGVLTSGNCAVSTTTITSLYLNMVLNEIYRFDLFKVEREPCTSEFLLLTENIQFNIIYSNLSSSTAASSPATTASSASNTTDMTTLPTSAAETTSDVQITTVTSDVTTASMETSTAAAAIVGSAANVLNNSTIRSPLDITLSIPENTLTGSYIGSFGLTYGDSTGSIVDINITEGNELGHFRISATKQSNETLQTALPINGTTKKIKNQSFIDCTTVDVTNATSSPGIPAPITTNLSTAHIFLHWILDYEQQQTHYLYIIIKDRTLNKTGSFFVKIEVTDANDNCPVMNSSDLTLPLMRPPLSADVPMVTLNVTDQDSNLNAQLKYLLSDIQSSPASQSGSTLLKFKVLAYDSGSPTLGSFINVTVEVSDTCLYVPRGKTLTYEIELSSEFNEPDIKQLYFRLPGYYSAPYPCGDAVGFQSYLVPNQAISASSEASLGECEPIYHAFYARLHTANKTSRYGTQIPGAWVPALHDDLQWIQTDFGKAMRLESISTQGSEEFNFWITEYYITYSADGITWNFYQQISDSNPHDIMTATSAPDTTHTTLPSNPTTQASTSCFGSVTAAAGACDLNTTLNSSSLLTNTSAYVLRGSSDASSVSSTQFESSFVARFVRLHPTAWHDGIGLRMEMYGCEESKRLNVDSKCFRCPSGSYCPGNGEKFPCGRCSNESNSGTVLATTVSSYNNSCSVSRTEFSFGGFSTCSPCPAGYICEDGTATLCAGSTYTEGCNASMCSPCAQCESGSSCRSGLKRICEVGHFSNNENSDRCLPCPSGTFQNETGSSGCDICPAGYYSELGMSFCLPCRPGQWSYEGSSGCFGCTVDCLCRVSSSPCYPGVNCINVPANSTTWKVDCLNCPLGFTGDGFECNDIDECLLSNPCFEPSLCVNTLGGFYCNGCPSGYHGDPYFGYGLEQTIPNQACHDIDECSMSYCDALVQCNNTMGNYSCGQCPIGYTGNGYTKCVAPDPCVQIVTSKRCGLFATCDPVSNHNAVCECPLHLAGPGIDCGDDLDADGQPDLFISCGDWDACAEDNCIGLPNSGQEDTDGDRRGDACDKDDDNDFVLDHVDNCPLVPNYNETGVQLDSDSDGFGDACDTCPFLTGQFPDNDGDGLGDACDDDDDNDGTLDGNDVCPLDPSVTTGPDVDGDGIGDACDNCVNVANSMQADSNQNHVGDACDDGKDADGDSVLTFLDNCPFAPNPSQSDADGDGIGDACDEDSDNDGKLDSVDHCPFTNDTDKEDDSHCVDDFDNDSVQDVDDSCKKDPTLSKTSLLPYFVVNFDSGSPLAKWEVFHQGREVTQSISSPIPSALIGSDQRYSSMDYTGSVFVNEDTSTGQYIGLVFSYQNHRNFYLVAWRNSHRNDEQSRQKTGLKGLQIKVVHSTTGPGTSLSDALWHTVDTQDQVDLIYHDPELIGWNSKTPYKFLIEHRPSVGSIRAKIFLHGNLIIDSGPVYDTRYTGGRVGVFALQQGNAIWSNLKVKCVDRENTALLLDGVDDHVVLPTTTDFHFEDSFTIEVWIRTVESPTTSVLPILCTINSSMLCIFLENGIIKASFGDLYQVSTNDPFGTDSWQHVTLRYDAGACELTLLTNGTLSGEDVRVSDVPKINWLSYASNNSFQLAIGWDGTHHFRGLIDDLRIYDRPLLDAEVDAYLSNAGLARHNYRQLLTGQYDMNYHKGSSTLRDRSSYDNHGTIEGNPQFVESTADHARYRVAYPNAR